jgi:hypothetical protein
VNTLYCVFSRLFHLMLKKQTNKGSGEGTSGISHGESRHERVSEYGTMNSESRCDAKKDRGRENKNVMVTQSTRRALLSINFFCIPIPLYVGGYGSGQGRMVKVVGPRKIAHRLLDAHSSHARTDFPSCGETPSVGSCASHFCQRTRIRSP